MEKFQIEHVIISMSLEVEGHTVPHLKAPISGVSCVLEISPFTE